uniref:Methyltransferase domain-containing protein n=1 Tax=Aureoumbra lagunensis TaxID=44058 RepID=A0A7S3NQ53_9STRA|mmetsp:Transcript_4416/g.6269  ORF Transcript_4416/g.6269 Transcript_4416/m.6269 type:complete len:256 (+) Transcript_4416:3-770(+)
MVEYTDVMSAAYNETAAVMYRQKYSEGDPTWDTVAAIARGLNFTDKSVLDVGCGPGINAEQLLNKCGISSYVGFDASEAQINAAKNAGLDETKTKFFVGDACSTALTDDENNDLQLDVALASFVVPHLASTQDIKALLTFCKRFTKPNASTYVVIGDDYGVVRASGEARDAMLGPVKYHLPENEPKWKTGVKFDVVFSPDFIVPAYLWDVEDVATCAKAIFSHVDTINAWEVVKDLGTSLPKEAAQVMFVLHCRD